VVASGAPDSDDTVAYVADAEDAGDEGFLAAALRRAGWWDQLRDAAAREGVAPAALRIVIKPELGGFAPGSPAATDPSLVEQLIDLLFAAGYMSVAVAAAPDSSALWAENRDVYALADLLGYRYVTPVGRPYEVLDLSEDVVDCDFAAGSLLHGSSLGRAWRDAHVRIVFAKNRTDEHEGYSLCLDSLVGVLPLVDKDYYYRHRFEVGQVVAELLQVAPVHIALIDAIVSGHGAAGRRAPVPIETGTIIASRSAVLADYVGALKMGLDPYVSSLTRRVVRVLGLPRRYRVEGNLAPYPGWRNVPPVITDSSRRRDASVVLSRTVQPWLQALDAERFPLKEPLDAQANALLSRRLADVEGDRGTLWSLVTANYAIAGVQRVVDSYRTLYDKDALRQREVPLNLEVEAYSRADYESSRDLLDLDVLLKDVPSDDHGLRWRYFEDAVLFEYARILPIPFAKFVAKVDVSRTIQFMNDYLGGRAVPVARDASGRVTHQAERNIYLPQPNYLVLTQGDVIDVTKLEYVEYGEGWQRMSWKTVLSENDSARHDDGVVTFEDTQAGTHVRIFGRQLFALPPFWQTFDLRLAPELRAELVSSAYRVFFARTFANLEALVEGREIRIGRAWHEPRDARDTEARLVDRLAPVFLELSDKYGDALKTDLRAILAKTAPTGEYLGTDELGFAHFSSPAPLASREAGSDATPAFAETVREAVQEFWTDLTQAVRRDLEWQARQVVRDPP
jgi:uncharacterized protein (DUF362 family)